MTEPAAPGLPPAPRRGCDHRSRPLLFQWGASAGAAAVRPGRGGRPPPATRQAGRTDPEIPTGAGRPAPSAGPRHRRLPLAQVCYRARVLTPRRRALLPAPVAPACSVAQGQVCIGDPVPLGAGGYLPHGPKRDRRAFTTVFRAGATLSPFVTLGRRGDDVVGLHHRPGRLPHRHGRQGAPAGDLGCPCPGGRQRSGDRRRARRRHRRGGAGPGWPVPPDGRPSHLPTAVDPQVELARSPRHPQQAASAAVRGRRVLRQPGRSRSRGGAQSGHSAGVGQHLRPPTSRLALAVLGDARVSRRPPRRAVRVHVPPGPGGPGPAADGGHRVALRPGLLGRAKVRCRVQGIPILPVIFDRATVITGGAVLRRPRGGATGPGRAPRPRISGITGWGPPTPTSAPGAAWGWSRAMSGVPTLGDRLDGRHLGRVLRAGGDRRQGMTVGANST